MDLVARKSTSGQCFILGQSVISWNSELQKCVALSTAEAEFIAASEACRELVWLRRLIRTLDGKYRDEIPTFYVDNQSAVELIKNPVYHKRTKHIDLRYHYIRHKYEKNKFKVEYICSENQLADLFTKALPKNRFEFLRSKLNVVKL